MVTLDIWYREPGLNNTHSDGATAVVAAVEELNAFVDSVLAETEDHAVPPMVQVAVSGDYSAPVLEVGLGPKYGFVHCLSRDDGWSVEDASRPGFVQYQYMSEMREIPANAEVPLAQVRIALEQFLATGTKPKGVAWLRPTGP